VINFDNHVCEDAQFVGEIT